MSSASLPGCVSPKPVARTGSSSCWVRLSLNEDAQDLCLSQEAWRSWLSHPTACGTWGGSWSLHSAPENSEFPSSSPKTVGHRFKVKGLPWGSPEENLRFRLWLRLEALRENLSTRLEPLDPSGIFRKLLLNQSTPGSPGNLLRWMGFVHLLTATGIHLYALAASWSSLLLALSRWIAIPVRIGVPLARFGSGVTTLLAWFLAGARIGMLRPFFILLLRGIARSLGFRWRKWSPLALSLFADLCLEAARAQPSPGHLSGRFLYSLAVGGGLLSLSGDERDEKQREKWKEHLQLSLGSWVFVGLWDVWKSQALAPFTPLFSVLSLPLFCGWVYPLLLLDVLLRVLLGHSPSFLLGLATEPAQVTVSILTEFCLRAPTLWLVPRWALLIGAGLAALEAAMGKWGEKGGIFTRKATVLVLACLAFRLACESGAWTSQKPIPKEALVATRVEQLDVDQGDAALIIGSDGSAGMIDTGATPALRSENWLEVFFQRGILQLDWIALTHLDQDHAGGALTLAGLIPIRCVATSETELRTERGRAFKQDLEKLHVPVVALESARNACVPFPFLPPPPASVAAPSKRNANMSAILVPLRGGGFYFSPGDADAEDENRMGKWIRETLPRSAFPRILKVAHHGSRSSDSQAFYDAIAPSEAWISAGVGNRYGHPSVQVLNSLSLRKIPLHRTDQEGHLHWEAIKGEGGRHRPP